MSTLSYFGCEISNGSGGWVDLNDSLNYKTAGGEVRDQAAIAWRRTMTTSPVLEGQYQVHAVKDQVVEAVNVYVYGGTHAELASNIVALENLFSQFSYQLRWRLDDSLEVWNCWSADYSIGRGAVFAHNKMALVSAQVPRFPDVTYSEV